MFKEMQARGPIAPLLELGFEVIGAPVPVDPPEEIAGPSSVSLPHSSGTATANEEEILKLLSELVSYDPDDDAGDELWRFVRLYRSRYCTGCIRDYTAVEWVAYPCPCQRRVPIGGLRRARGD